MDINPTYGITANEMLSLFAPGELYEGFRFAATDELITLLSHAGVSENSGADIGEADQVAGFIDLVGGGTVNVQSTFTQTTANGRTTETVGFNTTLYFSALSYYDDGRTYFHPRFLVEDPNRPDANGGNWIVREASTPAAVPIPAAVWLFGSGLLGFIGTARRRKGS
jgi:hypothetical protein